MTELICKLFIKQRNLSDPHTRESYGTLVGVVGIILNFLLCIIKIIASLLSGSVAMIADALNNLSDAGGQVISIISFKLSAKPADREHPFGHARFEYIASFAVSFFIIYIGIELLTTSVKRIFEPTETEFSLVAAVILAVSVLTKLWLFIFNRKISKKINSSVMRATAIDSLSDAGATLAVLISSLVLKFFSVDVDAYMGIAISLLIFAAGIKVLNEAKNFIIGVAPDKQTVDSIKEAVLSFDGIIGIHDLMVHSYGTGTTIASFHAEVDGSSDIFYAHDMIDTLEKKLRYELGIICTIHMDPIVTDDEAVNSMRIMTARLVKELDPDWEIHDFRMVVGVSHTNLIFDAVVPYECKMKDNEISELIEQKIKKELGDSYFVVLTIDKG